MRHSFFRCLAILFTLPLLFSCGSLTVENMVTDQTTFGVKHPATVALNVGGGSGGVKWYSGTIERDELQDAVQMSIEKSGLFKEVVDAEVADYILDLTLTYAGSHPGFTMGAWVNVTWSLKPRSAEEPIWNESFKGEGSATVGDAFVGAQRQYIAIERSAKTNIEQALVAISKLTLVSP